MTTDDAPKRLSMLADLETVEASRPGYVVLACIEGRNAQRVQLRFTALAEPDAAQACLAHIGGVGNHVAANGPAAPAAGERGTYRPRFWIPGVPPPHELEPLVEVWDPTGDTKVLSPSTGFLMTYGLVPRREGEEMHWDDLARPVRSVVVVRSVSIFETVEHSPARVEIRREYLQDYATLRGQCVLEVGFIEAAGPPTPEEADLLAEEEIKKWDLPGRTLYLRRSPTERHLLLGQADLTQLIMEPADAPVTAGAWDYGKLTWPGIEKPVTDKTACRHPSTVYVHDRVLAEYEGVEGFTIYPATGSVAYGGHGSVIRWSVAPSKRVGRDYIAIDLKDLYEGVPPEVTRHWHAHAIAISPKQAAALAHESNVAQRTDTILNSQRRLAAALARLASSVRGHPVAPSEVLKIDFDDLDYRGTWSFPDAERAARHVPRGITRDEFLSRALVLHHLVVETLSERNLRDVLLTLGEDPDAMSEWGSVKLLRRLLLLAQEANESGLRLREDHAALAKRLEEDKPQEEPTRALRALNELRNARGHRGNPQERIEKALSRLELPIDPNPAWGLVLDQIYDLVADELSVMATTLA